MGSDAILAIKPDGHPGETDPDGVLNKDGLNCFYIDFINPNVLAPDDKAIIAPDETAWAYNLDIILSDDERFCTGDVAIDLNKRATSRELCADIFVSHRLGHRPLEVGRGGKAGDCLVACAVALEIDFVIVRPVRIIEDGAGQEEFVL